MRHLSKNPLTLVAFCVLCCAFSFSCNRNGENIDKNVVISTESVFAGNGLPVQLSFTGYSGKVSISGIDVFSCDLENDVKTRVDNYIVSTSDKTASRKSVPFDFTIPSSGRYDLFIEELEPGTYMVSVSIKIEGNVLVKSIVGVIKMTDSGGEQPVPVEPIIDTVSDFTLPGIDNANNILRMTVGDQIEIKPVVIPSSLNGIEFSASSFDSNIVKIASVGVSVVINAISEGESIIQIWPKDYDEPVKNISVIVSGKSSDDDEEKEISDFTVPKNDPDFGRVLIVSDETLEFEPVIEPKSVTGVVFDVISSNENVATASFVNGKVCISAKAPGYCFINITPSNATGPSKSIPILVYRNVTVTIDFMEDENQSEEQIKQKTFMSYLRFSSDSPYEFDQPIYWTVSGTYVVSKTGKDTVRKTTKKDIKFTGNKKAYYKIDQELLNPAFMVFQTYDFNLRISISLARNSGPNPELWRISYDEKWKQQSDAMIWQYLTWDLQ